MVKYSTKKYVKKIVRKSKKTYKKSGKKSLVSLIKRVALKPTETKNTHVITENINLYHNVPDINIAHLSTVQGNTDNQTGLQNLVGRLGDEVILRGLSYKFWFANKLDRPNITYKIVFFRYRSGTTVNSPEPYYAQGTTNYLIRDLDTEKFSIIKVVNFSINTAARRQVGANVLGAEGHKMIKVYINLKNKKQKYENGSAVAKFSDIGYNIVAYDSFGTLITDNIASYAVNRKLYFKDP